MYGKSFLQAVINNFYRKKLVEKILHNELKSGKTKNRFKQTATNRKGKERIYEE